MKNKRFLVVFLLFIVTLYAAGCSKIKVNNNEDSPKPAETEEGNSSNLEASSNSKRTYINIAFTFQVYFPKEWKDIIESESQDGAVLYYKDGNDVRVFAEKAEYSYINIAEQNAKAEGKNVTSFLTDDGIKGILIIGEDQGKELIHSVIFAKAAHYDFYALVSKDFYKENEQKLLEIAKSMKILD